MCGATHKQFSIFFVYIAAILLNIYSVIDINFYLQVIIMLAIGKSGALFPDVDHIWKNVKEKTTINWILNKLIHITGGKHRSRHTHSWDICLVSFILAIIGVNYFESIGLINNLDICVAFIILCGFYSGWISHLFSDMLSSTGVYLTCFSKMTIKFVPKQLFGFKFNTGGAWENFCFNLIRIINFLTGLFVIFYPFIVDENYQNFFINVLKGLGIG